MPANEGRRPGQETASKSHHERSSHDDEFVGPPTAFEQLLPHHRRLIEASGISAALVRERGYESITTKAKLKSLGFSAKQCIVPALHVPVIGVTGEVVNRQIRPDQPRIGQNGKAIKYETPRGTGMVLDVPPRVRSLLGDPKVPLFITEGVRKADSAASAGLACIALLGVWNWRGTNDEGGKTALPEWESIALNGREVYIAFDSDVSTKPSVHEALRRLVGFLKHRGAKVKIIYLPDGPDGAKTGLDDYLMQGHGIADLFALSRSELSEPPADADEESAISTEYRLVGGCLARVEFDREGNRRIHELANFSAMITGSIVEDDGVTATQHLELRISRGTEVHNVAVASAQFGAMGWTTELLPPNYALAAGFGARDHARAAIQRLSGEVPRRTKYTHTGWRQIEVGGSTGATGATWAYLHGGGAIGPRGALLDVETKLLPNLASFELPLPPSGESLTHLILETFEFLKLGPPIVMTVLFAATIRATLGGCDFSVHVTGQTGCFKTELAALFQSFFGDKFNSRNLPCSWSSTANSIELTSFTAKDAPFVVDDFVSTGNVGDVARLHREADRVIRGQGNSAGRGRMNADGSLRAPKPPRGLVLSTGEEIPAGHSLRSRLEVVEMKVGDITSEQLTACQRAAAQGVYSKVMSAFLQWSASRRDGIHERMRERVQQLRAQVARDRRTQHNRTPDISAQLMFAAEEFYEFCVSVGAMDQAVADQQLEQVWGSLLDAAAAQGAVLDAADPVANYFDLLRSALSSGAAHLVDEKGQVPEGVEPEAVGWQQTRTKSSLEVPTWEPKGPRIGWLTNGEVYLIPPVAYAVAQRMADEGNRINVGPATLAKRLSERGCLVDEERERKRHTVRRKLGGARIYVLYIRRVLLLDLAQLAQVAHDQPQDAPGADLDGGSWAASGAPGPAQDGPVSSTEGPSGPVGPVGPVSGSREDHSEEAIHGRLDEVPVDRPAADEREADPSPSHSGDAARWSEVFGNTEPWG